MTSPSETPLSPGMAEIAAAAAELETAQATADQQPAPAGEAPTDYMVDAKGFTDIVAESIVSMWPSTEKIYTEERRVKIAAALAPVLQKYGWSFAYFFGRFGPEICLAFALSQVAIPTARAISADRAAAKALAAGEKPAAAVAAPRPAESGLQPVIDRTDPSSLHTKA